MPWELDLLVSELLDRFIRRKQEYRDAQSAPNTLTVTTSKPPWEAWELDENFFNVWSRWNSSHPENTLGRVLDKVSVLLQNGKEVANAIPDSPPVPVRGLVTALAHLMLLGIKIARARREVSDFVRDVVHWFEKVKRSFEGTTDGQFTHSAWRDLRSMRDLIEEICRWAAERLKDGRWNQVKHGLMIEKEITDFRQRIVDARGLFLDLSAVNIARGLDSIKRDLRRLFKRQDRILAEIENVRKAQQQALSGLEDKIDAQEQVEQRERFFADTLDTRTVTNATYDKQGKRTCDPDTRIDVLQKIRGWVNNIAPGSQNFLWLTGDPGCGKSAITASLAKECKDRDILWAQFFINRNNVETTNPESYFPSIARQLANRSRIVAETIHNTLKAQRSLMDDISEAQATKLFIDAIQQASLLDPKSPVIVIIDGLDETARSRLKVTAAIFSTLFNTLSAHGNVKVFISSRTEDEIRNPFTKAMYDHHVLHIHLDTSHPSSIRDVSRFIRGNLKRIVQEKDLNWEEWPGVEGAEALGIKAAGLFIWGVTAIKFLEAQIDIHGTEHLKDLLRMLTAEVLVDINTLYELILKMTYGPKATDWEYERFRRIVGTIVVLQEPLCLDDLAALLDLRQTPTSDPVDLRNFVRRLRTVLVNGADAINGKTIPRLHKSFFEFITSTYINAHFRVDPEYANLELAAQCLLRLSAAHTATTKYVLPAALRYSSRFWSSHLSQTSQRSAAIVSMVHEQLGAPAASLASLRQRKMHIAKPLILDFSVAKSQIQSTLEEDTQLWDAESGRRLPMRHMESATCLAFSPDGKQVVSCSADKSIILWDAKSGLWDGTCIDHSSALLTVAYSPDGKYIASGSSDHTLSLWDRSTGRHVGSPFDGHTGPVTCLAFSSNGQYIVSGSADGSRRIWRAGTGRPAKDAVVNCHQSKVTAVAFSPFDHQTVMGIHDGAIHIHYAWSGDSPGRTAPSGKAVTSVTFSRDGTRMASGADDGTVHLWDASTCRLVGPPIKGHMTKVLSIAFSSDGKYIFSGSSNTVCVTDISSGRHSVGHYKHYAPTNGLHRNSGDTEEVTCLAFSPDREHFASAGLTMRVYELLLPEGGATTGLSKKQQARTLAHDAEMTNYPRGNDVQLGIRAVKRPMLKYDLLRAPSLNVSPASYIGEVTDELELALSNAEEVGWIYSADVANGCLEGIQWIGSKVQYNAERVVLWAFIGDRIVRADRNGGSVTVFIRDMI